MIVLFSNTAEDGRSEYEVQCSQCGGFSTFRYIGPVLCQACFTLFEENAMDLIDNEKGERISYHLGG